MLGINIKKIRQSKGWSQEELGHRIGTTRQTISKWEKGYSVPDSVVLVDLSEIFECNVSELLGEEVEYSPTSENLANKLETLNYILAEKNNESRSFWKKVGKTLLIIFIAFVIINILAVVLFSVVRFETIITQT